jgi:hypothetical protein
LGLLVCDSQGGLTLGEFHLLFEIFLACGGELEELVHNEGCGYTGGRTCDEASKNGWSLCPHIHLVFTIRKV